MGVQAGIRSDTPFYPGHEVAGLPHHTLEVQALMLPPRGEVATCALGNSWKGARVRIPRPQGLRSICLLADLDHLEAIVAFSSSYLLWP